MIKKTLKWLKEHLTFKGKDMAGNKKTFIGLKFKFGGKKK